MQSKKIINAVGVGGGVAVVVVGDLAAVGGGGAAAAAVASHVAKTSDSDRNKKVEPVHATINQFSYFLQVMC